jgi:hypothetical protein
MTPGAALLVALWFQTASGTGATPGAALTRLRLEVHAPPACTSKRDLAARIAARSPHIEVVEDSPLSASVAVASLHVGSVVADLVLRSPGADQTPRRVVARSCAEVADGAALIIAVTLDPSLRRSPATGTGEERATAKDTKASARSGSAAAPPAAAAKEPSAVPASRPEQRLERPPATTQSAAPGVPSTVKPGDAPAVATKRELGATLAGQTVFGAAPSVMPGLALYATAALERDGPWSPALLLGATHVWRSDIAESGGAASFTLDAASLDACPLRLRVSSLVVRPCASALFGRLASHGSNTGREQPGSAARPFGAAGAVLTASVGSPLVVSARLGVGITLLRDSYELATNVFYRAAPLMISVSLGIGLGRP